jgi:hypothetical protein
MGVETVMTAARSRRRLVPPQYALAMQRVQSMTAAEKEVTIRVAV